MGVSRGYRRESGFSPEVMKLLADVFLRHGSDLALLSGVLRRTAGRLAGSEEQVREVATLCVGLERVSERIKADAARAMNEALKLAPEGEPLTICICGRAIETGECRTGGHCSRGTGVDIRS
jgi:hypothetical protein